jgi:hypothetical protein
MGSLPTPCHTPTWSVSQRPDAIEVHLFSVAEEGGVCSSVLEPFELSIALGAFETADLPVILNGEEVGRVEVGSQLDKASSSLLGAGWSFGMCMGYCRADLVVEGDLLVLTGRDQAGNFTLFTNSGSLTSAGRDRLDRAVAALAGVPLEEVYGCPDCADGGAAYLTLSLAGAISQHSMEFGNPPAELAEIHDLALAIIDALEGCQSGELVIAAHDCRAWDEPA